MENELPHGLQLKIDTDGMDYAESCPNISPHIAFRAGAITYAAWKVKYDELKAVHDNLKVCYEASIKIIDKQEAKHLQLKARCDKMEAALKTWIELDKLKEGDGFQKGFELQTKALKLTDEALAWTDGYNTESVAYIPGKGATLHEGINEKEGKDG